VKRREAPDDRRRVVLSLTPKGRALEARATKTRQQLLDLGHATIGDRDVQAAVKVLSDLLQFSAFAELLERRRELIDMQVWQKLHVVWC
jgi:DNA-binding MarR family transcriptional regulator